MNVCVNGKEMEFPEKVQTVRHLLEDLDAPTSRIAVEHNGEIVAPEQFATTLLQENDVIEIVTFVGGG